MSIKHHSTPLIIRQRALLVEDGGAAAEAFIGWIDSYIPQLVIIGHARTKTEAINMAKIHTPDMIILDLRIPEDPGGKPDREHGYAIITALRQLEPAPTIIVYSQLPEKQTFRTAIKKGARAFVSKDAEITDIIYAIRRVMAGEDALTDEQQQILQQSNSILTEREMEILELLADRQDHAEIAKKLEISIRTVHKHCENICRKFNDLGYNVSGVNQIVATARKIGFLD